MTFWKAISFFLKPRSGNYLDPVRVTPGLIASNQCPFIDVSLIPQPDRDGCLGLRVDYRLPKGCGSHHAQLHIKNGQGLLNTMLWLEVGGVQDQGNFYLINNLDESLVRNSIFLFRFSDDRWPVCTYSAYEIHLAEFVAAI